MTFITRRLLCAAMLLALAGCDAERDLAEPLVPLGNFKIGHVVVKGDEIQKIGPSRDVSDEEWIAALDSAVKRRFSRFEGDAFYHIGIVVRGYNVAPATLVQKSVLAIDVTVFDNDATKMEPEPRQFAVLESFGSGGPLGSGLTMSREAQVEQLAANAAKRIESWMRENETFFQTN